LYRYVSKLTGTPSASSYPSGCAVVGTGQWAIITTGSTAPTVAGVSFSSGYTYSTYMADTCSASSTVAISATPANLCSTDSSGSTMITGCSGTSVSVKSFKSANCTGAFTVTTQTLPPACQYTAQQGVYTTISCAAAAATPTTTATSSAAIIGGAVGGVGGTLLLAAITVYLWCCCEPKKESRSIVVGQPKGQPQVTEQPTVFVNRPRAFQGVGVGV